MALLSALFCVALVSASSYPDKTSCVAEDVEGLKVLMKWVQPAVRTDAYTLRTGDGCDVDPVSYIPGQFMSIHLRTHKYKAQFRGLLIYATDSQNNRVGDWHLDWPNSNMFWKPGGACENRSLMHLNGAEKYYHHEFKFETPPAQTGTIKFHTLIKRGEANTGEFYYANLDKSLELSEASATPSNTWVEGAVGTSCSQTCTSSGKPCDEALLGNAHRWAGALQKDVLLSVGCASPALVNDSAKTIYRDGDGWCTYPSPIGQVVSGACDLPAPAGTTPVCPCGTAGIPSFGATVPPSSTECLNSYIVMGSASKSSATLPMFLVLLTGLFLNQHRQANFLLTLVCVLFCAYTVQAHNWVYAVSRSFNQASTYKPCRPKVNDVAHWQINQGQEFTMEWATGHDHYFYFTVVHADDIGLLENTTQNHLDNYVKACADQDNYMVGKGASPGSRWAKQHINGRADPGQAGQEMTTSEAIYEKNVSNTDPVYIKRHEKFGSYGGEVRWVYKSKFYEKDKRCSYFNPTYPHIVAVHRFVQVETIKDRAGDRDIARFTIELSQGHIDRHGTGGQYLVQYLWRGYFDCADVDVFPDSVKVNSSLIGGRKLKPDEPQWNKVDHCQFEEIQNLETSCSEVVTTANRCLKSCVETQNCGGVNVVPLWLPKTVYPLFSNRIAVPWDDDSPWWSRCGQKKFTDAGRDAKVCYGLNPRFPNFTHASYTVTDDTEDPVFYSTCFVKRSQWTFDLSLGNSSGVVPVPVPPPWNFGSKCVDCNEWKASQESNMIPTWKLPQNCENCDKAILDPTPTSPGTLIAKRMKCDGSYAGKTVWDLQNVSSTCANVRCVKTLNIIGANDIQEDECIAKAKRDPECSEIVQHKGNGNNKNGCECFLKKTSNSCCGTCVPVDVNYDNWEWNIFSTTTPRGDPTCAQGKKSSDGAYCCSSSCVDGNGVASCMPRPGLQISFQDAAIPAPKGWAVDTGASFGPRSTPGYTSTLSSEWGWNCDLSGASQNRSVESNTFDYHSTYVEASGEKCKTTPEWKVTVPNGEYQVDTLYSRRWSNMRGCKVQGIENYDKNHAGIGWNDMDWVSRVVSTSNGTLSFTGGLDQCPGYNAIVIYPKETVQSEANCQSLPGMCCPLFLDMENRPCSKFQPPCKM